MASRLISGTASWLLTGLESITDLTGLSTPQAEEESHMAGVISGIYAC